jgi:serine/threonine protein kinase
MSANLGETARVASFQRGSSGPRIGLSRVGFGSKCSNRLLLPAGRKESRLRTDVALEMVAQIAAGLTAIQEQHLVHRDIKPSNIMISFEEDRIETVKIIDLGLAKGCEDLLGNFDEWD